MLLEPESDYASAEELAFRLKGHTRAGKRWNRDYERMIDEYETAIAWEDPGWATSTAAEISKCYNGMQRKLANLAGSTSHQKPSRVADR